MSYISPQRRGCMLIYYSVQKVTELVCISSDENSETPESSAINDGRSILAMFIAVLYKVEGLETETLK